MGELYAYNYTIKIEGLNMGRRLKENMDSVIWFYDANLQPQVKVMETTISSNSPCHSCFSHMGCCTTHLLYNNIS